MWAQQCTMLPGKQLMQPPGLTKEFRNVLHFHQLHFFQMFDIIENFGDFQLNQIFRFQYNKLYGWQLFIPEFPELGWIAPNSIRRLSVQRCNNWQSLIVLLCDLVYLCSAHWLIYIMNRIYQKKKYWKDIAKVNIRKRWKTKSWKLQKQAYLSKI